MPNLASHQRLGYTAKCRRMLSALLCCPFQNEKDSVENLDRMVHRKGYAHVVDSRMQVAPRFGKRIGMGSVIQVKSQVLRRAAIGEGAMVPKRYDL
jgi:hypothetical protein